ncbi:MAG: DUF5675 family protein [Bacteroidota bacterium]
MEKVITVVLKRFKSTQQGTFGIMHVGGKTFFTAERPWLENKPYVSCIPVGVYGVRWVPTGTPVPAKFDGHTWGLSGGNVGLYDRGLRTYIRIHSANLPSEVNGCIAPGTWLGMLEGRLSVANSMDALMEMYELLPREFNLRIEQVF